MAQKIEAKDERPLQTFWLKDFLAVDTTDSRIAPPNPSTFYDLLNAQPVGFSNIHSVDGISPSPLYDFLGHTIYRMWGVNIFNQEYLICAGQDRELFTYQVSTGNIGALGVASDGFSLQVAQYDFQVATSYYGYDETERHFGLGTRTNVDVVVRFPSGRVTRIDNVAADQTISVLESDGN